ncbi:MAG: toprim domain-containing protein, partial [Bacteroidota bacterium]
MKTIIAEKPSVAKEIAHIVGADKREEGYMQGNGYYVTWAFGHLVQPAMPETYGMKGFHAENLPVIPDPFVLVRHFLDLDGLACHIVVHHNNRHLLPSIPRLRMSQKQQTMKTIIAEKPSVAKEIAHIVGADKREEGYMQGNGYYVTWAFGHLVQPAMPETYGMKGFHAENLPVIPEIKIIGKLFDSSERIIVATDAGREGELIFRYLYAYLGCQKPFDRLW